MSVPSSPNNGTPQSQPPPPLLSHQSASNLLANTNNSTTNTTATSPPSNTNSPNILPASSTYTTTDTLPIAYPITYGASRPSDIEARLTRIEAELQHMKQVQRSNLRTIYDALSAQQLNVTSRPNQIGLTGTLWNWLYILITWFGLGIATMTQSLGGIYPYLPSWSKNAIHEQGIHTGSTDSSITSTLIPSQNATSLAPIPSTLNPSAIARANASHHHHSTTSRKSERERDRERDRLSLPSSNGTGRHRHTATSSHSRHQSSIGPATSSPALTSVSPVPIQPTRTPPPPQPNSNGRPSNGHPASSTSIPSSDNDEERSESGSVHGSNSLRSRPSFTIEVQPDSSHPKVNGSSSILDRTRRAGTLEPFTLPRAANSTSMNGASSASHSPQSSLDHGDDSGSTPASGSSTGKSDPAAALPPPTLPRTPSRARSDRPKVHRGESLKSGPGMTGAPVSTMTQLSNLTQRIKAARGRV